MKKLLLAVLLLTGCASNPTPEEIEAKFNQDIANAEAFCGRFYTTDEDLKDCVFDRYYEVLHQEELEELQDAQDAAIMGQALSRGMVEYSRTMSNQTNAFITRPR
jgi:hypothetical protein